MKQKQYSPMTVADMGLSLYAVNEGYLDKVAVAKVIDYEVGLHDFARGNFGDVLDEINKTGDYNDDVAASLKKICDGFAEKGAY